MSAATNPGTMTVRGRDGAAESATWGSGSFRPVVRTVTIPASCPTCGGVRGIPSMHRQYEGGEWFLVDVWTNPCGHLDMYDDVIREAAATLPTQHADPSVHTLAVLATTDLDAALAQVRADPKGDPA